MNKQFLTSIVIILIIFSSCDIIDSFRLQSKFGSTLNVVRDSIYREQTQASFIPPEFNETSRLFYLCKIWGFVKYYHQNENNKLIDVDSILLQAIPKIIDINEIDLFRNEILKLINAIQISPIKGNNPYPNINDYCLINNNWMKDSVCLNELINQQLNQIFLGHTALPNNFVFNRGNEGTIRQSNEKTYKTFEDEKIRLLGLFQYWNMIYYFYPSKNYIDQSWDLALYESIPLFRIVKTKKEYHREIYRLTNRLKDTHSSFPPSIDEKVFGPYRPNFRMMNIKDTFIINEIRFPENNTEQFKPGDIVLGVDGKKVKQIYDSLQSFIGGGNYWSNQSFVCNAVLSRYNSQTAFTILRGKDTLTIHSNNKKAWDLHKQKMNIEKSNRKKQLYKWLADSIAYFNLESANSKNFKKNFTPIKHAKVIILDLRNYPSTNLIESLADNFVPPHSLFAYVTYADARFPGMLRQHRSSNYIGHKKYFKGKVIVLVNEWTESYSEYITMLLQANPNTIVVGSSSSGADGNVSTLEFPGGVKTIYSGIGIYYPGMLRTQRIGVKIDYVIEPTVGDIQTGKDAALEKALYLVN